MGEKHEPRPLRKNFRCFKDIIIIIIMVNDWKSIKSEMFGAINENEELHS